ncbi:unnamed protein product, partial [Strongylus vulgaris]
MRKSRRSRRARSPGTLWFCGACANHLTIAVSAATLATCEEDSSQAEKAAKARKRKSRIAATLATCEDDGTQVERATRTRRRTMTRRGGAQIDTPEFRNAFREFCLQVNRVLNGSILQETFIDLVANFQTGVQGLVTEFLTLRAQTQPIGTKRKLAFDANPQKNRYKDVYCADESRVVLSWPPGANDYIHANWITGSDVPKKFICTQAGQYHAST